MQQKCGSKSLMPSEGNNFLTKRSSTIEEGRWDQTGVALMDKIPQNPYIGDGVRIPYETILQNAESEVTTKQTADTPGYYRKIARGEMLPMNPYQRTTEKISYNRGNVAYRNAGLNGLVRYADSVARLSGLLDGLPLDFRILGTGFEGEYRSASPALVASVDREAATKTRLKIGNQQASLGESFLQINKTIDLVGTNTIRFVKAMSALEKGNIAGAWTALGISARRRQGLRFSKSYATHRNQTISQFWIELQYGWKPLIQDIYGSVEALHQYLSKSNTLVRATAQSSKSNKESWHPNNCGGTLIESTTTYGVKYVVYYRVIDPEARTLQQLGIINPALVAWDLVPWSFAVDWVLPIGNWLSSMTATVGLSFHSGCKMIKLRDTSIRTDRATRLSNPLEQETFQFTSVGRKERTTFQRIVIGDFPSVTLPSFKNPFSRTHLLNALALATLLVKRK